MAGREGFLDQGREFPAGRWCGHRRRAVLGPILAALVFLAGTAAVEAANGCPPGGFSITHSPDGHAASVLFDDFSASVGGSTAKATATCNLSVPMTVGSGRIAVYHADYRGFAFLAAGQKTKLVVTHAGGRDGTRTDGPFDGDLAFSDLIGGNLDGTVDSRIVLMLTSGKPIADALALLDSVDLAEAGSTSLGSVEASIDRIARDRAALAEDLGGVADGLLGFVRPIEGDDGLELMAGSGSAPFAVTLRRTIGSGFSVFGGAAAISPSVDRLAVDDGILLAGGLRYVWPGAGVLRPFAEAGIWGSPDLAMHVTRRYDGGIGFGDVDGSLVAAYGRGGLIFAPDPANEFVLSGSVSRQWLDTGAYAEAMSDGNLFPAAIAAGTATSDTVKAALAWTTRLPQGFDLTLSVAAGKSFGPPVAADVAWIGSVEGTAGNATFVEYGGRVGWQFGDAGAIGGFVAGRSGGFGDSAATAGGYFRLSF